MADPQPTCIENEEWRDIPGWEGYYQVSDHGRIRSVARSVLTAHGQNRRIPERVLKPSTDPGGYLQHGFSRLGRLKTVKVHHLVASAFLGPRPDGAYVCHNNGNQKDNRLVNLRYGTPRENIMDKFEHGTMYQTHKTHCPRGHKLLGKNLMPSKLKKGVRQCLACARAHSYLIRHEEMRPMFKQISDSYYCIITAEDMEEK